MANTSLMTLNNNVLAAVDVETTGRESWYHEIIQIAVVPLDCNVMPVGGPFYTQLKPEYPGRMMPAALDTHGITIESLEGAPSQYEAAEALYEWFQSLNIHPANRLVPLVWNSQFDIPFLQLWLGYDNYNQMFGFPTRDPQALVTAMMDKAAYKGVPIPFNRASLKSVCTALDIPLDGAHDALCDALATAAVYRTLLGRGQW